MVTLKDAVAAARTDLRVMANEGHSMTRPLGILSGVVSSLPEGGDGPILLAKDACEALVDRAHEAEDADLPDLAERLRGVNRALSPVVAGCFGSLTGGRFGAPVTVAKDVLVDHGYTEIVDQDDEGEVTLRNKDGGLEVFAVRDSFAGWSVPTDDGRVLEFCRSK